jgi:diadenosine tetraphosphatase ApaH/serine/threonine PP2A family protein phosphatase
MLTVRGTPEEVAADIAEQWSELSRIPLGLVGDRPQRSGTSRQMHDVLDDIPPAEYVQALTWTEVPSHGMICCPLPDHDERTPSFRAYEDPARGWFCFGCGRGGSIYDLGAALWGMSTRGPAFHDLRRELARALLGSKS